MVSGIVLDVAAECACCRWPSNLVAATSCPTCFDADRLASPHQDDVGFRYAERRGMSPWSVSVPLQATELHPKVVVGVPADNLALNHPTPHYPRVALSLLSAAMSWLPSGLRTAELWKLRPIRIRRLSWLIP